MKQKLIFWGVMATVVLGIGCGGFKTSVAEAARGWYCIYCCDVSDAQFKPSTNGCAIDVSGRHSHNWMAIQNAVYWKCQFCGKKTITNGQTPGRGKCSGHSIHHWMR